MSDRSYIVTGHAAEKIPSKKSRRSSTRFYSDRRVMSRHSRSGGGRNDRRHRLSFSRSGGERNDRRRRSEKERRRRSSSHSRRRQSKHRRSYRKRSEKISDDSDNFSISSIPEQEHQESQLVMYEGETSQQMVIRDDEQEEHTQTRPDPDGIVLMLDNDNNQVIQLEAGDDDRLLFQSVNGISF